MKKILSVLLVCTSFISCQKDEAPSNPAPGSPLDDRRTVLLKDIVAEKLPNPYYNFKYDTANYVTEVSFASDLFIYKVEYENKRVKKLTNIKNGRTLVYNYAGNNVTGINEFSLTNIKLYGYELSYNNAGKLIGVIWKEFINNPAGIVFKKVEFAYHSDGNLSTVKNYGLRSGALVLINTRLYNEYDNKPNVDDFYLMMDFFDSFLFLPQVKLQKNNPRKEVITNEVNEFDITYTYEFSNNLPVRKMIDMLQTKGTGTGQRQVFTNQFTYY